MEHRRSIRSSALFTMYLFLGALLDATKSRSFFLRPGMTALGGLAASSALLKLLLLILQEVPKQSLFIDTNLHLSMGLEATGGLLYRLGFLFLGPLFVTGFRGQISMNDLDHLGPDFAAEKLYQQLKRRWNPRQENGHSSSNELFKACMTAWWPQLLAMVFARLVAMGFDFAQPFIFQRVIEMVGQTSPTENDLQERGGLLGSAAVVFFGLAFSRAQSAHMVNRFVTCLRGAIIALIFHKEHSLTESEAKRSAAVTLMSTDIDAIATSMPRFFEIPIAVIQIGFGIYVLSGFIGVSCLAIFAPLLITTAMAYFIGVRMARLFANWNASIESRIATTMHVLSQLTAIKTLGLGPVIGTFLQHLRIIEIESSKLYRRLEALYTLPVILGDLTTPVAVIAAALFGKAFAGHMVAAKVFPILAVVALIQRPLILVLNAFGAIAGMLACFARIEAFLKLQDREVSRAPSHARSSPPTSFDGLIRFNHADIAPPGVEEPILRDVDFEIMPGAVAAMIGTTGSGKSALVQGILGQTQVLGGSIEVDASLDDLAFCGQTVWLRDDTIRQNVIGCLEYNEQRFQKVIQACLLEDDLELLPGGADYMVGKNGSNLSGGQCKRLGIARTAYAGRPLTILDDSFSSLDRNTAVTILQRLCGRSGMLREIGSTVILVSYLPEILDVADQFILVAGQTATLRGPSEISSDATGIIAALNDLSQSASTADEAQKSTSRQVVERCAPASLSDSTLRKKGDLSLYMIFINPIGVVKSILQGLLITIVSAGEILPELFVRIWTEVDPENPTLFVGYMSIALATAAVTCLAYFTLHTQLAPLVSASLHEQLVQTTVASTLAFQSVTESGDLINRYSQDMTVLSRDLPAAFFRTIYAGASSVIVTGVVLSGATYLACALPVILVALFFIQRYYLRTSRQVRHLDLEMKAPLYTYFEETAAGLTHIQAFNWQEPNIHYGILLLDESQQPFYTLMAVQQSLGLVLGLLSACVGTLLVGISLFVRESSSQGSVGLSFLNLIGLSYVCQETIIAWTKLETSSGALARLSDFTKNTPQEDNVSRVKLPETWPSHGQIQLTKITAHYDQEHEARPVLNDFSLSIPPGHRVGIVGRSGSGKSSLLMVLLGFIQYQGTVEIDGVDISKVSRQELRSRLVTITQDQVRFNDTVRANLLPFTMNNSKPISSDEQEKQAQKDREVEELLESLNIWEEVKGKGGLNTMLDLVGFSNGQLQLMCIARAILRQRETGSKVVLVDEATSSVDATAEAVVHRVMREHFSGCTVITVAHRKSGIDGADSIVGLHRGERVDPDSTGSDSESVGEAESVDDATEVVKEAAASVGKKAESAR